MVRQEYHVQLKRDGETDDRCAHCHVVVKTNVYSVLSVSRNSGRNSEGNVDSLICLGLIFGLV